MKISSVGRMIICMTVAVFAIGTTVHAQPPGTLAPKGLIIKRTPSGGVGSVRTFGGYAPGTSTARPNLFSAGGTGGSQGFGQNFFLRNSTQARNPANSRQAVQSRQFTQSKCNGKGLCWSDLRLKRDAELIAHQDNGLDLYRYRYLGERLYYVGVMAQDVARLVPEAVAAGEGGFLRVDYRRLGLRLQTWDEWSSSP
jgi:hypothetical protein